MYKLTVKEALADFYGIENISNEAFTKSINYFYIGKIKLPYPNLSQRQSSIYLHDINHLLTGYGTSSIGEGEVAAYELASGFPLHCWVGYLYAPFAFIGGLFLSPSRVFKAYLRGRGAKNACHADLAKDQLMQMSLDDLRNQLQIPAV